MMAPPIDIFNDLYQEAKEIMKMLTVSILTTKKSINLQIKH